MHLYARFTWENSFACRQCSRSASCSHRRLLRCVEKTSNFHAKLLPRTGAEDTLVFSTLITGIAAGASYRMIQAF
jgi:hypothetical protein